MSYRTIRDLDLRGKRVLLRVDFNVPLDAGGMTITSDARIRAALPTLKLILEAGGSVVGGLALLRLLRLRAGTRRRRRHGE